MYQASDINVSNVKSKGSCIILKKTKKQKKNKKKKKNYAYLQTILKACVKFIKDRPETVVSCTYKVHTPYTFL